MRKARPATTSLAAALLALVLLTFASVQSHVMQAAMAVGDGTPTCGDRGDAASPMNMAAMGGAKAESTGRRGHHPDASKAQCGYCAVAAHAPLLASPPHLPVTSTVAFADYLSARALGPRGPPAVRPRARRPTWSPPDRLNRAPRPRVGTLRLER